MNQSFSNSSSLPTTAQEECQPFPKSSPIPTIAQEACQTHPCFILLIPCELFTGIISLMSEYSELELSKTCKMLYGRYEQHHIKKTAVVVYTPERKYDYFSNGINALRLFNGWSRLKYDSWDPMNGNYPIKILCLNIRYDVPTELDILNTDALVLFSKPKYHIELAVSLKVFTKLKSLSLVSVDLSDDAFSALSNPSLIESIHLESCAINSELFEKCTIPQIQLEHCEFSNPVSIKPPSSLKIFGICSYKSYKVDASGCTQLESL
jgi:hypothetical protein